MISASSSLSGLKTTVIVLALGVVPFFLYVGSS
jgi:hypothetical protein